MYAGRINDNDRRTWLCNHVIVSYYAAMISVVQQMEVSHETSS